MGNLKFHVPDMSCAHCVKRITTALEEAGYSGFNVDLETKTVHIETEDPQKIMDILDEAGYSANIEK
ncbi:MAG: heavy-metal-associated domain-containing protein [Aminobacterium sp.]|uniref:heavy-metal-associated domain-containing protein n=1 Tax=unclassified Aminobacterium TaxID=2685012 RepID=UPI001BCEA5FB|nr:MULTISPECIES: heavy-metal-associated domain-containing protein [unclassified Aminobacterium]MDD2206240.1 heavy-metal-associated domain-containing protein [Aminobacterium sp.]MDD3426910.1 heavy-metal-associated domain-containing protein [Aminobacterium sp.]MDD3707565.1 heavy-metal-associated domain-containing protein [Aminobacterium sp.]MDD4229317.1 heavy-metal-associated domain-containing protein [Aminobacterium sp.]MDD4552179.1 heavy-metal-associated domain-containing protein [Aminobacteri